MSYVQREGRHALLDRQKVSEEMQVEAQDPVNKNREGRHYIKWQTRLKFIFRPRKTNRMRIVQKHVQGNYLHPKKHESFQGVGKLYDIVSNDCLVR